MKKAERDALVALIDNVAGPVPSVISDNLAVLDEIIGRMPGADQTKARAAFTAILNANLKLGTSPGQEITNPGVILSLRQKVMALSVDEEPVQPPTPPVIINPPPSGVSEVPCRYKVTAVEAPQHFRIRVPDDGVLRRISPAIADGKQIVFGYSANPNEFVAGQATQGSGTAMLLCPAGTWYVNYKLAPGMGGVANGDISVY